MKPVTCDQMRRLDMAASRDYAIPSLRLMENAGRGVSQIIFREFQPCRVLVFVGKGNNGGDGLVVARHLSYQGYQVRILLLENPAQLKSDPLVNFNIAARMKIPIICFEEGTAERELAEHCRDADLVVDAIFGIGIHKPVEGVFEHAIRGIQKKHCPILSIDIPSGLDADTGKVWGAAVKATRTAALGLPKKGFYENEGPAYSGEIEIVDIGLPRELLQPFLC